MAIPDFTKVRSELDYLYWLICESNPELVSLPKELVFFKPVVDTYVPDEARVEIDVTYYPIGKTPKTSRVTYTRQLITLFCSDIDVASNGLEGATKISAEADRVIFKQLRDNNLEIEPQYTRRNNTTSVTDGNVVETFTAEFNSLCLYGRLSVKLTTNPNEIKKLAACIVQSDAGPLTKRDLRYYPLPFPPTIGWSQDALRRYGVVIGAVTEKNPELVRIERIKDSLSIPGRSRNWDKASARLDITDPADNIEKSVVYQRLSFVDLVNNASTDDYEILTQVPVYMWTIVGTQKWIAQWLDGQANKIWNQLPPNPDYISVVMPSSIKTDAQLKGNTQVKVDIRVNDQCYWGGLSIYINKVTSPVTQTITSNILVGVLRQDVTAGIIEV